MMDAASQSLRSLIPLLGLAVLLAGGCTTSIESDREPPKLVVARGADDVQLTWNSVKGQTYTVLFTDDAANSARWQILPGFSGIRGTGRPLFARDRVSSTVSRRYKLDTVFD